MYKFRKKSMILIIEMLKMIKMMVKLWQQWTKALRPLKINLRLRWLKKEERKPSSLTLHSWELLEKGHLVKFFRLFIEHLKSYMQWNVFVKMSFLKMKIWNHCNSKKRSYRILIIHLLSEWIMFLAMSSEFISLWILLKEVSFLDILWKLDVSKKNKLFS